MNRSARLLAPMGSAAIVTMTAAGPAQAQIYDHMGMWNGTWGWGHMVAGSLLMLLFWGGLIVLIALLFRAFAASGRDERAVQQSRATSMDLLEERYARGEINREEFEERRQVLLTHRAETARRGR